MVGIIEECSLCWIVKKSEKLQRVVSLRIMILDSLMLMLSSCGIPFEISGRNCICGKLHVKHLSLKYGGIYSVFSFIFFSKRFCSPFREKTKGVSNCFLCGCVNGDTPDHIVGRCTNDRVMRIIDRGAETLGISVERLKSLLLFVVDWNTADDGKALSPQLVNGVCRVHSQLYRCRKRVRDDLKRRGFDC